SVYNQLLRIDLLKVHKHKDERFIKMLNFMRAPVKSDRDMAYLVDFTNKHLGQARPGAVRLCSTNKTADAVNKLELAKLIEEEKVFTGFTAGNMGRDLPTELELVLKRDAKVMFCAN